MTPILLFIGMIIISYFIGCFSIARLIAKFFKSLNIYKVGTGHPDTQNIYQNVDKGLGIMVGIVDFGKIYIYLAILKFLHNPLPIFAPITTLNHLLILGFFIVVGHCLPITHHFKGGRGIFSYLGYITFFFVNYFSPWPVLIVVVLAIIVVLGFKQYRFAQFMIVLLPPFINFFFEGSGTTLAKFFIAALLMGIMNVFVSKRLGEI